MGCKNKLKFMRLVECDEKYWEFVRLLRIDKRVIDGFIKTDNITQEMQKNYMEKNSNFFRVALIDDEPVGFIGVIDDDIRVCTHPEHQNKGVGKFMVENIKKIYPKAFAKIKIGNEKSLKLFESCGFKIKYFILETDETQSL